MEAAHDRQMAIIALWCAAGLAVSFTFVRLYVRIFMVKGFGYDDSVYILALLPLIASTTLLTLATIYNWGPANNPLDARPYPPPGMPSPALMSAVGQGVLVLGSALAKTSVGMFQLRFVTAKWQRWSIYLWIFAVLFLAVAVNVAQYASCVPSAYFWDPSVTDGTCYVDFLALYMVLVVTWIIVDFYYAVLPWVFVRHLNMPHKEKVIVVSSMSLGILASAIGIVRVVGLTKLDPSGDSDTTLIPVIYDTWEYAITMVCVCIPVCNPLWLTWARRVFWSHSRRNQNYYNNHRAKRNPYQQQEYLDTDNPGSGGILIQIGGPGGRVIRFNPVSRLGGGGGKGHDRRGSTGRFVTRGGAGPVYALQTIGGSDMTKTMGSGAGDTTRRYSTASIAKGGLAPAPGHARKGSMTVVAEDSSPVVPELKEPRWSASSWKKSIRDKAKKSKSSILNNGGSDYGEGQVSELELRGDFPPERRDHDHLDSGSEDFDDDMDLEELGNERNRIRRDPRNVGSGNGGGHGGHATNRGGADDVEGAYWEVDGYSLQSPKRDL